MKFPVRLLVVAACLGLALPAAAHRAWLLPSATVLSDTDSWITVDAAVSNDLFYFEHFPMRLANVGGEPEGMPEGRRRRGGPGAPLTILAPDGSQATPMNGSTGRYRSTFDVKLDKPGTYKLAVVNDGLSASYKENGERKRWRGTAETFSKEVPAGAEDLKVTLQQRRMEVFVTAGKPTNDVLKTSGKGLELDPVTHPNDLYAKEPATFRLLLDGKPAADVKLSVIRGGIRYRDALQEINATTDKDGKVTLTWPEPGMYWLEAEFEDDQAPIKGAKRRASYTATLEVLPQ